MAAVYRRRQSLTGSNSRWSKKSTYNYIAFPRQYDLGHEDKIVCFVVEIVAVFIYSISPVTYLEHNLHPPPLPVYTL